MSIVHDYYQTVIAHEEVFRNILRDLRDHREERPGGSYVPEDLKTEASLDEIFEKYIVDIRFGKFIITSFSRSEKTKATIGFQNVEPLSGGRAELEYLVNNDNSVNYQKPVLAKRILR